MIITLIFVSVIVIGIILLLIGKNNEINWRTRDIIKFIGACMVAIGIIASFFTVGFIIDNTTSYDVDYQNMLHKREMLEYRIEHMEENITGNEMLYNDIVEFNNELRSIKKWANNPWTSWFNNQDIASIDYIELNGN